MSDDDHPGKQGNQKVLPLSLGKQYKKMENAYFKRVICTVNTAVIIMVGSYSFLSS
jgi:hypothetical protein